MVHFLWDFVSGHNHLGFSLDMCREELELKECFCITSPPTRILSGQPVHRLSTVAAELSHNVRV